MNEVGLAWIDLNSTYGGLRLRFGDLEIVPELEFVIFGLE